MRIRTTAFFFVLLSCWCATLVRARPVVFADHEDKRIGFKIQTPRDWTAVPLAVDETWVVGKYLAKKSDFWTEKGGYTAEHRAGMQMIAIVSENVWKRRDDRQAERDKKEGGKGVSVKFVDERYKDYKAFLAGNYHGGGFYLATEEETKVGDVAVTCLEYKVERMAEPKRLLTWVYHLQDVDLAVQFEALENAYPKMHDEWVRCLKSFRPVPRVGELDTEVAAPGRKHLLTDLDGLTVEGRRLERTRWESEAHSKAESSAPQGWTAKKMGRFLVVSHTDDKYSKRIVDHADATFAWFDKVFADFGPGEYVRAPILRICKDWEEVNSYYTAGDWDFTNLEIVSAKDSTGGKQLWEVNQQLWQLWSFDRDRHLVLGMPPWMRTGIQGTLYAVYTKAGKIELQTLDMTRELMRSGVKEKKLVPPRELIMLDRDQLGGDDENAADDEDDSDDGYRGKKEVYRKMFECQAFCRFLLDDSVPKTKKAKEFFPSYLKNLKQVVMALEEEEKQTGEKTKEAATEEEEDAQFKAKRQAWKLKQKRIMEETFSITFRAWTDADWKQLTDDFYKSIS